MSTSFLIKISTPHGSPQQPSWVGPGWLTAWMEVGLSCLPFVDVHLGRRRLSRDGARRPVRAASDMDGMVAASPWFSRAALAGARSAPLHGADERETNGNMPTQGPVGQPCNHNAFPAQTLVFSW